MKSLVSIYISKFKHRTKMCTTFLIFEITALLTDLIEDIGIFKNSKEKSLLTIFIRWSGVK